MPCAQLRTAYHVHLIVAAAPMGLQCELVHTEQMMAGSSIGWVTGNGV